MAEKKIVISISEDGEINSETFGIVGHKCIGALDEVMADFAKPKHEDSKDDMFKEELNDEVDQYDYQDVSDN